MPVKTFDAVVKVLGQLLSWSVAAGLFYSEQHALPQMGRRGPMKAYVASHLYYQSSSSTPPERRCLKYLSVTEQIERRRKEEADPFQAISALAANSYNEASDTHRLRIDDSAVDSAIVPRDV